MSVPNFSSPACPERLSRVGGVVEIGYIAKLSPAKLDLGWAWQNFSSHTFEYLVWNYWHWAWLGEAWVSNQGILIYIVKNSNNFSSDQISCLKSVFFVGLIDCNTCATTSLWHLAWRYVIPPCDKNNISLVFLFLIQGWILMSAWKYDPLNTLEMVD